MQVTCGYRGCKIDSESFEAMHFIVERREQCTNHDNKTMEILLNKYDFWVCRDCIEQKEDDYFSLDDIISEQPCETLRVISSVSLAL